MTGSADEAIQLPSPQQRKLDCFRLRAKRFGGLPALRSLRSKRRRVAALAMTWKHELAFPRHGVPEVLRFPSSLSKRGRRESRAPNAPAAWGVRSEHWEQWLGREGSNLRMAESKSAAPPNFVIKNSELSRSV